MKPNYRIILRCTELAIAVLCAIALAPGSASAQTHTTGLPTTKTCPAVAESGTSYTCSFTVTNADEQHGVMNLIVTDSINGAPATAVDCFQGATAVTSLGAAGSGGESCGGTVPVTAAINCTASNQFNTDQVSASAVDAAPPPSQFSGLPVSGSAKNNTLIPPLVCDDDLLCTDDSCDPQVGCVTTPHVCNDNNACTTDACDPAIGCTTTPVVCNDNNACTNDACDPIVGCQQSQVDCNDDNACTTDSCDPATGCQHAAVSCNDENGCTTDRCDPASGCEHETVTCADSVCTACNPQTGVCDPLPEPPAECVEAAGRMTGGGSVFTAFGTRVTHGFELHCDSEIGPNNLEINWLKGQNFHLEQLTSASCADDPNIAPQPPTAGFDTYVGTGIGRCNGVDGATIRFTLTDAGEPGKNDTATFEITGCPNDLTLSVSGKLKKGNHQAHAH